jgi:spermidine synthase
VIGFNKGIPGCLYNNPLQAPEYRSSRTVWTLDALRRRALLGVFVISGFTGLIYESIWTQYLKLFLGHAAYAQTLVLVIFMGGLAIGSWIIARYSTRLTRCLLGYVVVEALIGVLGISFHRVFTAATDFSFAVAIPALPAGWPIHVYKWALAALLALPQSVLLGMTFPLIGTGLIRRWPERPGDTLATLYFTNSLGAAFGVLISGFVLIRWVGLPGTILTAGLLNIALAFLVWMLSRHQDEPAPTPPAAAATDSAPDDATKWFLTAAFLTGAASFMYELGWIRMLSLVLGSATHSFELMLSAFIFGLALGGLFIRKRIERIANADMYLGGAMVVMGCLAALTLPAYNAMFDFMAWSMGSFARTTGGYVAINTVGQSIAVLIMVPTTFMAGMTLPLLTHALLRRGRREEAIGTIYSVNTFGAIVGVLYAVHVLMPFVGVKGVILTGAAIHIGLGLSRLITRQRSRAWSAGIVVASVAIFGFTAIVIKLDASRMASGVFRTGFATVPDDATVPYLRDGRTATISVVRGKDSAAIATNGKTDASLQVGNGPATADEATMVLAAAIPLSMHPNPERVANIGFGSGLTTHTLLASEQIKRLDSIEIEPFMVEGAHRAFGPRIRNVFQDPRSHIVFEDAKTFFASASEPYDMIVSEPSNPWVSGVSSLFSDEFYGRITHYLRPGGYFVQWLQVYETNVDVFASIVKALSSHFGTYALYNLNDADILIVATLGPELQAPDERIFAWPLMRAELSRVGVRSLADLQWRRIGDRHNLGVLLESMPVSANSDYYPYVDLNAPRLRYLGADAGELPHLTALPMPFLDIVLGNPLPSTATGPLAEDRGPHDTAVREALAIRRAVASGNLAELNTGNAASLLLIDMSSQRCSDPRGQVLWRTAVLRLSQRTAAYLGSSELEALSQIVTNSPCYRAVAGEHRTWADLAVAISRRDAPEIAKLGSQLLESHSLRSADEQAYLLTVTAAANVRLGQLDQAGKLIRTRVRQLGSLGEYALPLQELLAMSRSSAGRATTPSASTQPASGGAAGSLSAGLH